MFKKQEKKHKKSTYKIKSALSFLTPASIHTVERHLVTTVPADCIATDITRIPAGTVLNKMLHMCHLKCNYE